MTNILFYPAKNARLIAGVAALPEAVVLSASTLDELREKLPAAEVLVTSNRSYEADAAQIILDLGRRLRWLQFTTSGIDKAIANGLPNGIPVTNAAGTHAHRVAEHAMWLLLSAARRQNDCVDAREVRVWARDAIAPRVMSLAKRTLLVIGVGAVGQEMARKAKAFDMRVIGVSRSLEPLANFDEIRPRSDLLKTLAEADAVALTLNYSEDTHHMIDAGVFAAMKPTAVLVNVARGLLIDEAAMIDALKAGKIAGVALDVTVEEPLPAGSPLWTTPNVVMTPHIAGAGGDSTEAMADILRDNYARFRAGQPLAKWVHGPTSAPVA